MTDDDLRITGGNAEYLSGKLQVRHGIAKDKARKQIHTFDNEELENQR